MRVLKEKVIMRLKAFNVLQLTEFLVSRIERFYECQLLDIANNRLDNVKHSKFTPIPSSIDLDQINKLSSNYYSVPSESKPGVFYQVNTEIGMCTCYVGLNGGPCKHQAAVVKRFNIQSLNIIPVHSVTQRHALCTAATGRTDINLEWFASLRCNEVSVPQHESVEEMENEPEPISEEPAPLLQQVTCQMTVHHLQLRHQPYHKT